MTDITGGTGSGVAAIIAANGRHPAVPGAFNLRDVGGYPTADGGVVRWRTLLRSGALHLVAGDGTAALAALNLRTVIDLRTPAEVQIAPSPPGGLGVQTLHISIVGPDFSRLPEELDAVYRHIVDECGPAIGTAIRRLAEPGALPALLHCAAGKDRTGIVVALVLASVGVCDEIIAADYALSGMYLDPGTPAGVDRAQQGSGLGDQLTAPLLHSPPELILDLLGRIRNRWDGPDGYLIRQGLGQADLQTLRDTLVEHPAR